MEEKYFYIDSVPYYFKGKTFGIFWNGWSCPSFSKEVCEKILQVLNIKYKFKGDILTYIGEDWEEEESLTPNNEGLYSLGACSWTWSEVSEETLKEEGFDCKGDIIEEI